jgi:hypothetical protein
MSQRLDPATTASLVREAVRIHGKGESSADDASLGDLIEGEKERKEFQTTIVTLVRRQKFRIQAYEIPIHRNATIEEISRAVAMSALPGETESPPEETEEPKAPEPDETAGKKGQERKQNKFEEMS